MLFLYSQPKVHLRDYKSISTLDEDYKTGILRLILYLVNNYEDKEIEVNVSYELVDVKNGQKVVIKGENDLIIGIKKEVEISFKEEIIEKVMEWSAEHPNLYTLLITLKKKVTIQFLKSFLFESVSDEKKLRK